MCELLGMCFAKPISANITIGEFAGRGEENADGWGLAWYPDRSVAVVKEPERWKASQYWEFLPAYKRLQSHLYIAHVRLRTMGGHPAHADTHPFVRELGGRAYCFAHNGTLADKVWELPLERYRPMGTTDSEHLFCHLLEEIAGWEGHLAPRENWPRLHKELTDLNRLGKLNCLLADGERLFCYHDAGGWKGLVCSEVPLRADEAGSLKDDTIQIDVTAEPVNYGVVVATSPLSLGDWQKLQRGELVVLEGGSVKYSSHGVAAEGAA